MAAKPAIRCQRDRIKPELRITPRMSNVNVSRLSTLQAIEEKPVASNPKQRRHCFSLHSLPVRGGRHDNRLSRW
jgi:hypothetical protein